MHVIICCWSLITECSVTIKSSKFHASAEGWGRYNVHKIRRIWWHLYAVTFNSKPAGLFFLAAAHLLPFCAHRTPDPYSIHTRSCGGCRLVAIVTRPEGWRLQSSLDSLHRSRTADLCYSKWMREQGQNRGPHAYMTINEATSSVKKIQKCIYVTVECIQKLDLDSVIKLDITATFQLQESFIIHLLFYSLWVLKHIIFSPEAPFR